MSVGNRIDLEHAARLLAAGAGVREVALACGVSTQAVYKAIANGRLPKPEGAAA